MDRSTDLYILSRSDMFRGLSAEALEQIRATCVRKRVARGETLFHQDEPASVVHVVVAGHLKVVQTTMGGQQIIIRYVKEGETVGYNAASGDQTYASSASAVENTTLLSWTRTIFQQLMARHPQIALNALAVIQSRYEELQTRLRELTTESVERRIAHTILRLLQQAGRRTADGIEIAFPLSRQDVAEMSGTTLHTASRTISAWESGGIIDGGRRRIIVRKPHELSLIAGEELGGEARSPG